MKTVINIDNINHPKHYLGDDVYETIKVLEAWLTPTEFVGFLKGNALKYNSRHRHKGGLEDLHKAKWYQDRLVEFLMKNGFDGKTEELTKLDRTMREVANHNKWAKPGTAPEPLDTGAVAIGRRGRKPKPKAPGTKRNLS